MEDSNSCCFSYRREAAEGLAKLRQKAKDFPKVFGLASDCWFGFAMPTKNVLWINQALCLHSTTFR
jgi:hypothetical protein